MPCSQAHTAEVFYASNTYWAKNAAFPGNQTIKQTATAECNKAFAVLRGDRVLQVDLHLDRHRAGPVDLAGRGPGPALRRLLRDERAVPSGVTLHGSIKGTAK